SVTRVLVLSPSRLSSFLPSFPTRRSSDLSSFDEDMQGSWLTVNYDPWGIGITYSGYLLLGVSMLWMLVSRGGEFRRLLRHPLLRSEEHTSELQSRFDLVCRLLLEKKKCGS